MHSRFNTLLRFGLPLALAACGSGGDDRSLTEPITLYHMVTECHEDSRSTSASQRLQVVRGDDAPVILAEIPTFGRLPSVGLCPLYGASRSGELAAYALGFQRMAVSPDGSGVVFEVNFGFSIFKDIGVLNPLTAEQEGIFFIRSDGTGLRRLGDASREAAHHLGGIPMPSNPTVATYLNIFPGFSPDGTRITFTDRGPGPSGEDAAQVVILDVATGMRTQVTTLPLVTTPDPSNPVAPAILYSYFTDNDTIGFVSRANPVDPEHPDGLNPEGIFRIFHVKEDGRGLFVVQLNPVALPGSHFVPDFSITRPVTESFAIFLSVPGTPVNPLPPGSYPLNPAVRELFLANDGGLLQLTTLGRHDSRGEVVDSDNQQVIFLASADPFWTNPSENCQIFSVSSLGGDLKQLTNFSGSGRPPWGCQASTDFARVGCFINNPFLSSETQTVAFYSDCDPLGTNPTGGQFFSMRPDGTGLRQLTAVRGMTTNPDDSVDVELAGPFEIRF